jgi:hypothetical protein
MNPMSPVRITCVPPQARWKNLHAQHTDLLGVFLPEEGDRTAAERFVQPHDARLDRGIHPDQALTRRWTATSFSREQALGMRNQSAGDRVTNDPSVERGCLARSAVPHVTGGWQSGSGQSMPAPPHPRQL